MPREGFSRKLREIQPRNEQFCSDGGPMERKWYRNLNNDLLEHTTNGKLHDWAGELGDRPSN
jgi:hypothetical protein